MKRVVLLFVLFFVHSLTFAQSGIISTIAGSGIGGFAGDGGFAIDAKLNEPTYVRLDSLNNIYIADQNNSRIGKIDAITGVINTIAGLDSPGYSGDGGLAVDAKLNYADALCVDDSLNVYIADQLNYRIRKISSRTNIISTIAGNGVAGYSGDGMAATDAKIGAVTGICIDDTGNIYIADFDNRVVRKINITSGIITTIGSYFKPTDVFMDHSGNLFIDNSNTILKLNTRTGITTYVMAESGFVGSSGDGELAINAFIESWGIFVDDTNNIFVTDIYGKRIREILASNKIIYNIAGNDTGGFSGDGGYAVNAKISISTSVCTDRTGNVYIADGDNNRIRKVNAPIVSCTMPTSSFTYSGTEYLQTFSYTGSVLYVDSVIWDLGDGTHTSSYSQFTHNYSVPGEYEVCAIAYSPCGNDTFCSQFMIDVSVPRLNNSTAIILYPNPTQNEFTVSSTNNITHITITNLVGQMLYNNEYNAPQVKINLAGFSPGIYLIRINDTEVRKFVKE